MGAGDKDITIELIEIDDVGVLIGVVFGLKLKTSLCLSPFVLQKQSIGVPTVESMFECGYFVKSG